LVTYDFLCQSLQDWKEYVCKRSTMFENIAQLSGALMVTRHHHNAAWLEALIRGHKALDLLDFRSNYFIKKSALDRWRARCLLNSAVLPGVQRTRARTRRAMRIAFAQWIGYIRHRKCVGRKLSKLNCRHADSRVVAYFDLWLSLNREQRITAQSHSQATRRMRSALFSSVLAGWKLYRNMQQRKTRLQQVCSARLQRNGTCVVSAAVLLWQDSVRLRKAHDGVSSQLAAQQHIISRLKHFACAQLLKSTLDSCQMQQGQRHLAFQAFSEFVNQKKSQRRTRRLVFASTRVRRTARCLCSVFKVWYQDVVRRRLQAIETHVATAASLATTVQERRESHEKELEDMISILGLRFSDWETELLETQQLLHASCDTFLPHCNFAATGGDVGGPLHDRTNTASNARNSSRIAIPYISGSATSSPSTSATMSPSVISAWQRVGAGMSQQVAATQGSLAWSTSPSKVSAYTSAAFCLQESFLPSHGDAYPASTAQHDAMARVAEEHKDDGQGNGMGGGEMKHESDSDFSRFGLHDADDWHAMPQRRPLSAASCSTNANPQE